MASIEKITKSLLFLLPKSLGIEKRCVWGVGCWWRIGSWKGARAACGTTSHSAHARGGNGWGRSEKRCGRTAVLLQRIGRVIKKKREREDVCGDESGDGGVGKEREGERTRKTRGVCDVCVVRKKKTKNWGSSESGEEREMEEEKRGLKKVVCEGPSTGRRAL